MDRLIVAGQLFDNYAANLSQYFPHYTNKFLCPLCLTLFPKDAIESKELTLEHIIPSEVGGRLVTLTCSKCNSGDGSQLDAHLIQRFRIEDILTGKSDKPLEVRVSLGQGEFGANYFLSNQQNPSIQIIGIPKISNPKLLEAAVRELESGVSQFSIKGNLGYKELPSRVAALRMAYLLAFSYFGYGYVLYQNLQPIREQIAHPEYETDSAKSLLLLENTPARNVIALLKEPPDLRCFLAIIEIQTSVKRNLGVVLPGPDDESKDIYQRWASAASANIQNKARIDIIKFDRAYISDPEYRFLPAKIWIGQVNIGDASGTE
ncbi:MAG: hypothetical protein HYZ49_07130 [Chloroflexi bacterium]|nr:hypothetical protein [Chloroflexota bacterium]